MTKNEHKSLSNLPNGLVPSYIQEWFGQKRWQMHSYQKAMFEFYSHNQSALLIAPTGGGKTLASFLPALADIQEKEFKGLHTLYISPLKALSQDIHRNLLIPLTEMKLSINIAIRTGDTPSHQREKQLKKPPHILLTTPESLMLLLSYPQANVFFKQLHLIIVDELHSFAYTKRGDLTSLILAQLSTLAPNAIRIGLSATVANPELMAKWLSVPEKSVQILIVKTNKKSQISLLAKENIPYVGYKARYAVPSIYKIISQYKMSIIFVNTRANAEFLFNQLWLSNKNNWPIAIYHGSLSKEQRQETEDFILKGKIKSVIATSALELGIHWDNVEVVLQIGAPHGVSRLLQRIGRSNHQHGKTSKAYLIPTNCFDAVESLAAINAIAKGNLDSDEPREGSLDVVIQFIINCACSEPVKASNLLKTIRKAYPYLKLKKEVFSKLIEFASHGGSTLQHYPEYHRLIKTKTSYKVVSSQVIRRHRQNIGTIIEAAHLRVKVINKKKNKIVGNIEESFVQELVPGDSFLFAGEILEYIRIHDMFVETRKINSAAPKLPSYNGGTMPLSTFLAEEVRRLLNFPNAWHALPKKVREWINLQQQFSRLPDDQGILIEQFPYKKKNCLVIYSFEGRRANHSLGMLITRRMERLRLKPISFTTTDYSLSIITFKKIEPHTLSPLFSTSLLNDELEKWLQESTLLKRTFKQIAIISGLITRQIAGKAKTMKQVTFSTDLIYDVLQRHEPDHILLKIARINVNDFLLDFKRLIKMLKRFRQRIILKQLNHPSPFSIPILMSFTTEKIRGEAEEEVLTSIECEIKANELMEKVKKNGL